MNQETLHKILQSRTAELPLLPGIAQEAMCLSGDPSCTPTQLASVIEREPMLATSILSLANSAAFSCGAPVVNIRQAIVRLGFRQCRNLILTSSTMSLMKQLPLEQEWVGEILNHHSVVTANAATYLNRSFGFGFQGEEYLAGLLHDFGRMLIAVAVPDQFAVVDSLSFVESDGLLEAERAVLETDHCEIGAWFAEQNNIPEVLTAAIRYHHEPQADQPSQKLAALVAAADHIANHIQVHEERKGYVPAENKAMSVLSMLEGHDLCERFEDVAPMLIVDVLSQVGQSTQTPCCTEWAQ